MAIGLGLGFEFGLTALGFVVLYGTTQSFIYRMVGKYGFFLMSLLAVFQTNVDAAYASSPNIVGAAYWLLVALLLFSLFVDSMFFITKIIPRRKNEKWAEIFFG